MPIIIPKTIPAFSTLQVRITLLATQSYIGKNTPQSHLERFYKYFSEIAHNRFDGAIITGAGAICAASRGAKWSYNATR